jgi:hypothetical protein
MHSYHYASGSNPGSNYNYRMFISGIETTSQIASVALGFPFTGSYKARLYESNELIDQSATWSNNSGLLCIGGPGAPYYNISGTKYIGLRISDNNYVSANYPNHNYCWLKISKDPTEFKNKLLIESIGYNKCIGSDITAGQVE